jgi:ferredoxin
MRQMTGPSGEPSQPVVVEIEQLQALLQVLAGRGYRVIGPTVRDGAVLYDEISSAKDLPLGWTDEQRAGAYRLRKRPDAAVFGYVVGPHTWKQFLHPPAARVWQARRNGRGFEGTHESREPERLAFLGVRPCELHAIAIQDKVFLQGPYVDPGYRGRREQVLILAVNCSQAGGNCFCASMGTGPKAASGFDLALTEVREGDRHYLVVEAGSPRGAELLAEVPHQPARGEAREAAARILEETAARMGRRLETRDLPALLYRNLEHPRWEQVGARCLTCGNCTLVCPTCFCTTVEDVTDLTGRQAERWRRWDSCFTMDFSFIHGGSVRYSPPARYRHWLIHKLGTWFDQFGTSGCVGCGRCITWCPAAIDLTEEVRAIRETEQHREEPGNGDA